MAAPPGLGLGARHHGGGAAALCPGAALPHRQSGFDPDALALGKRRARGAKLRADRAHGAFAADDRDRVRGWPLLQPSRHRLARAARAVSTITQQTAKNLFLWSGRSFVRKALEFPLALWIDFVLPKRRVLEIYLNIAEWGPNGQFGAEAGSRYAFNKSVRALAPREAALLAAVLPNPRRRSAKQPGPAVRRLAAIYEARGAAQASLAFCAKPAKRSDARGLLAALALARAIHYKRGFETR